MGSAPSLPTIPTVTPLNTCQDSALCTLWVHWGKRQSFLPKLGRAGNKAAVLRITSASLGFTGVYFSLLAFSFPTSIIMAFCLISIIKLFLTHRFYLF